GIETPAGAKGQRLSGGQAMKVAIARILFKDPNILLLDEATAALDEKSQAQIVAMIQNDFKDKIVISISHRLSTIRDYDRILVFDRGQVVQEGTYDELLAEEGLFQEMLQQEGGSSKTPPAKHVDTTFPLPVDPHEKPYESSEIQRAIALSPVFANMPSDQIILLEHMSSIVKCPKDTILFQRGDEGDELFIVLNGEVEFFVQRPDNSAEEIIDRCGAGGTFGELALFGNVPRTLSARTNSDSQFCILKSDDIEKLVEIHPGIALSLLETVSRRVANLRDTMYAAESEINNE
ncbi:MAG: cyclic nucleotide-binding domain-containing protein, partial [Desulfuromonadales bacterium]|nr:cyclic nucleotide-binding domain-containing protein [Desulfuromonadales bacterium]